MKALFISICLVTVCLCYGITHEKVDAVGLPFGGPVLTLLYCPEGVLVTIGPPVPGTFVLSYATPFLHGPPYRTGQFILGNYIPNTGTCYGFPAGGFSAFYGSSL